MRKWTPLAALAIIVFALVSCQRDKYAEVRKLLTDYIAMTDELNKGIDEAKTGDDVAAAIRTYVGKMKVLGPKVESLPDKYPELESDPPQALRELISTFENAADGMGETLGKLMTWMDDEKVLEALSELEDVE